MAYKKLLITGAHGLLGSALKKIIQTNTDSNIILFCPTHNELDLTNWDQVNAYIYNGNYHNGPKFDAVIHLAARVGGLKANTKYIGDFYTENVLMNTNILRACLINGIPTVISVLSTCVYPDAEYVIYPLTEDQLHNGPPHESNFGYAYAKRMLEVQSRAYRQQYGCNYICVIPNNLFGYPGDNFDLENSHVIPALIRKIFEAKIYNKPEVDIWGSGNAIREFTYSFDAARIIYAILTAQGNTSQTLQDAPELINIGNPYQHTILEVADSIKCLLDFNGNLKFDASKPEGQFQKPSSNKKLIKTGLWKNEWYTPFDQALKETCEWFVSKYPHNIRGIK